MANNERYSRDPGSGLPEVSPELIAAYNAQPHFFETEYTKLKAEQAAIAHDLATGVRGIDPHFLELKRAFAQGALYMYGLLRTASQTEHLERMFDHSTDGDDGGEDQPLSA